MIRLALLPVFFLILASSARGECPLIGSNLKGKMEQYKAARASHIMQIQALLKEEAECKTEGDAISVRAAKIAKAEGCEGSQEAGELNQKILKLSQKCDAIFTKRKEQETILLKTFDVVQADLDEGVSYMKTDFILTRFCRKEVELSIGLSSKFLELEKSMLTGITRTTKNNTNFQELGKLSDTLGLKNIANRTGCKADAKSETIVLDSKGSKAAGSGSVKFTGKKHDQSQSSITGVKEDEAKRGRAPASMK